jgi:hypothetical protein
MHVTYVNQRLSGSDRTFARLKMDQKRSCIGITDNAVGANVIGCRHLHSSLRLEGVDRVNELTATGMLLGPVISGSFAPVTGPENSSLPS